MVSIRSLSPSGGVVSRDCPPVGGPHLCSGVGYVCADCGFMWEDRGSSIVGTLEFSDFSEHVSTSQLVHGMRA